MTPTIEVRTFRESDRAALLELFPRAGEGAPGGELWGHMESLAAIYLTPYLDRTPDTVYLGFLDGALSGYLTGCLDSSGFPSEEERMRDAMRRFRVMRRPRALRFFARAGLDVAVARLRGEPTARELIDARWPAHLHTNVAAEARGTGLAAEMMAAWLRRLDQAGAGCYLQTLLENRRAVRFFGKSGFEPHGRNPVVPGLRSRGGRLHQLTMVRAAAG